MMGHHTEMYSREDVMAKIRFRYKLLNHTLVIRDIVSVL